MKRLLKELRAIIINYKTTIVGFVLLAIAAIGGKQEWFDSATIAVIVTTALGFLAARDIKQLPPKQNNDGTNK